MPSNTTRILLHWSLMLIHLIQCGIYTLLGSFVYLSLDSSDDKSVLFVCIILYACLSFLNLILYCNSGDTFRSAMSKIFANLCAIQIIDAMMIMYYFYQINDKTHIDHIYIYYITIGITMIISAFNCAFEIYNYVPRLDLSSYSLNV